MKKNILLVLFTILTFEINAQKTDDIIDKNFIRLKPKKYFQFENEGNLISTGILFRSSYNEQYNPNIRYSAFSNIGFRYNVDFNKKFGIYTGLGFKNIGFINYIGRDGIENIKRRTYNIGVPLGLKFGNFKMIHFYGGVGLDHAFNYKEKINYFNGNKIKFNEWGSDRINKFQPFIFTGFSISKFVDFKTQYYFKNFFNQNYLSIDGNLLIPYKYYDIRLIFISFVLRLDKDLFKKKLRK